MMWRSVRNSPRETQDRQAFVTSMMRQEITIWCKTKAISGPWVPPIPWAIFRTSTEMMPSYSSLTSRPGTSRTPHCKWLEKPDSQTRSRASSSMPLPWVTWHPHPSMWESSQSIQAAPNRPMLPSETGTSSSIQAISSRGKLSQMVVVVVVVITELDPVAHRGRREMEMGLHHCTPRYSKYLNAWTPRRR